MRKQYVRKPGLKSANFCAAKEQTGKLARLARIGLGALLLVGGLAGLVLPILQGIVMIMAGLALLRKDIPWVARLWDRWGAPGWERCRNWIRWHIRR